ncbi:MAG: rhomboid family intramembrane serine protease [bacterium]
MNQGQFRVAWPPFTLSVKLLAAYFGLQWLIMVLLEPVRTLASGWLVQRIFDPSRPWTLLTNGLIDADFISAAFAVVGVWLFGAELERTWGLRKFWGVQIAAIVVANLAVAILNLAVESPAPPGWSPAVTALATAFCLRYWDTQLSFFGIPMNGKIMLAFFVGLSLVMSVLSLYYGGIVAELAAVGVGVVASRPAGLLRDLRTRWRLRQARKHVKLVRKPEDDRPDYKKMN